MASGGADDGAEAGEEVGAPVGTETAGDFAVDRRVAQFAFRTVVIGRDVGVIEKRQQRIPDFAVAFSQAATVLIFGRERHDFIEIVLEAALVTSSRRFRQFAASPRQHAHAQEPRLHARRKDHVSGFDGELAVAQLMSKAHLPLVGVALLRPVQIRHP